ncbi:MAG TPA: hypothetical protein VFV01_47775 [Spirillospora sp.]|nr:hypothetical protein [Spirillospora sp.]
MVMINGGPAGPDASQADGAYHQQVDADRAALWDALGGQQGVLRGCGLSTVAGQLQVSVAAGSLLLAERDAGGGLTIERGYHVYADADTAVVFGAPSAGVRNDALIACFADTEAGALGTGVTQVGPQLLAVPGTSGVATPVPDASINSFVGRGGWLRLADVTINPGDTQVAAGSIAANGSAWALDSGWVPLTLLNSWTEQDGSPAYRVKNGYVSVRGRVTINGGTNYKIAALPVAFAPAELVYLAAPSGNGYGRIEVDPDGSLTADSFGLNLNFQSLAVGWPLD